MVSVVIVTVPTYHSPTHACGVGDFGCDGDRSYLPLRVPGTCLTPRKYVWTSTRWLRDELADRFVAGVVLHTGPRLFHLDDRIVAAPICTLWA